jgi:hypothetical protein
MRLRTNDHAEALAVARRLQRSEPATAADDRRALLLFWYGSGATRLHAEEDVLIAAWERHGGDGHPLASAIRAGLARLTGDVRAIAADSQASPARLSRALAAHVLRHERELQGVVELTVPAEELAEVDTALRLLHA